MGRPLQRSTESEKVTKESEVSFNTPCSFPCIIVGEQCDNCTYVDVDAAIATLKFISNTFSIYPNSHIEHNQLNGFLTRNTFGLPNDTFVNLLVVNNSSTGTSRIRCLYISEDDLLPLTEDDDEYYTWYYDGNAKTRSLYFDFGVTF